MSFPTIHISCPCSDTPSIARHGSSGSHLAKDHSDLNADDPAEVDDDGQSNFNPYSRRANFSLYPLNRLLFCEDCNQIRCPRCILDEIVSYFCPNCLFEVPNTTVKSEGNRCTRNCYSCPVCLAVLSVTALGDEGTAPYILLCNHCLWSSSDIGIELDKPTSITAQLAEKLKPSASSTGVSTPTGGKIYTVPDTLITPAISGLATSSSSYYPSRTLPPLPEGAELSPGEFFTRLQEFYKLLKSEASDNEDRHPNSSRLMDMLSTTGTSHLRPYNQRMSEKPKPGWAEYGHNQSVNPDDDLNAITAISSSGFSGTTSLRQRLTQPHCPSLLSELVPLAALLRTKRSKRCRTCRHILYKPESKVGSIRCRIRLVAMNYIPTLNITRFDPSAFNYHNLIPLATHQFLLTVTNPLYDPISVHLATPRHTPGKYPSNITIYCPEFEVGANTDVWDEALASASGNPSSGGHRAKPRDKKSAVPGQIWDRGRNWTSVIIEIVPPALPEGVDDKDKIVKVPVFVRSEFDTEVDRDVGEIGKGVKERREYAFWSSIDVGRIGKKDQDGPQRPQSLGGASVGGLGERERRSEGRDRRESERMKRSSVR
ncbi:hypothetical protein EX30DRAFT_303919 [Ascodesmis nigricans]|uniref:Dynactin subunit 4 n=1 Tax=Ascodesmis nigricans TaxID=341454 RepID=A0A4S2N2J1_9PEZI|nr:hypothetical protein EX30DRAFT_303919 [Ascodesmis nigricans]